MMMMMMSKINNTNNNNDDDDDDNDDADVLYGSKQDVQAANISSYFIMSYMSRRVV